MAPRSLAIGILVAAAVAADSPGWSILKSYHKKPKGPGKDSKTSKDSHSSTDGVKEKRDMKNDCGGKKCKISSKYERKNYMVNGTEYDTKDELTWEFNVDDSDEGRKISTINFEYDYELKGKSADAKIKTKRSVEVELEFLSIIEFVPTDDGMFNATTSEIVQTVYLHTNKKAHGEVKWNAPALTPASINGTGVWNVTASTQDAGGIDALFAYSALITPRTTYADIDDTQIMMPNDVSKIDFKIFNFPYKQNNTVLCLAIEYYTGVDEKTKTKIKKRHSIEKYSASTEKIDIPGEDATALFSWATSAKDVKKDKVVEVKTTQEENILYMTFMTQDQSSYLLWDPWIGMNSRGLPSTKGGDNAAATVTAVVVSVVAVGACLAVLTFGACALGLWWYIKNNADRYQKL